uniref:Uncharacterized protein n=1 Tax=Arundo donax TaxID=35708 RepID=A0A0A8YQ28_ARUDO
MRGKGVAGMSVESSSVQVYACRQASASLCSPVTWELASNTSVSLR